MNLRDSCSGIGKSIWLTILLATFSLWFGGFAFYVSFVVPIGTEVLGSAFEQGMITRQVTVVLNYVGIIAVSLMVVDAISSWKAERSKVKFVQFGLVCFITLMLLVLFWLHPKIDAFVDTQSQDIVGDYDQFYFLHRLYLWASTFQWIAAWGWLYCFARRSGLSRKEECGCLSRKREPMKSVTEKFPEGINVGK